MFVKVYIHNHRISISLSLLEVSKLVTIISDDNNCISKKNNEVVVAGDGQVSMGNTVVKKHCFES